MSVLKGARVSQQASSTGFPEKDEDAMSANWTLDDIEDFWLNSYNAHIRLWVEDEQELSEETRDFFEDVLSGRYDDEGSFALRKDKRATVKLDEGGGVQELGTIEVVRESKTCECDIYLLMRSGCQCGGE